MLRETIQANTKTDVDAVVSQLRGQAASAGLDPNLVELLSIQVREVLLSFVEQGKRIAAVGSQLEVTRDLVGEGYAVRLEFREGMRRSLLQKLLDKLRGS